MVNGIGRSESEKQANVRSTPQQLHRAIGVCASMDGRVCDQTLTFRGWRVACTAHKPPSQKLHLRHSHRSPRVAGVSLPRCRCRLAAGAAGARWPVRCPAACASATGRPWTRHRQAMACGASPPAVLLGRSSNGPNAQAQLTSFTWVFAFLVSAVKCQHRVLRLAGMRIAAPIKKLAAPNPTTRANANVL